MAAWQIIGYILLSMGGATAILVFIDMIKTFPHYWNMTPAYEEDEE